VFVMPQHGRKGTTASAHPSGSELFAWARLH
jgi:hypothetical protein